MNSRYILILNSGQEGPQPSNLSKLIFYASSKPQKLAKIGAYLEKRLKLDLRRYRVGYVRVTLQIISALIDQCRQHLNLFSKSVLRIILEILGNPDPDLIVMSTSVFVSFSRYYDHTASEDVELNDVYSHLVDKFCALATYLTADQSIQHKMHLAGLKGLHSMVASDTFLSGSRSAIYANKIIPAAMSNVHDPIESASENETESATSSRTPTKQAPPSSEAGGCPPTKRASITDDLITDFELEHIADGTLRDMFVRSNVVSVKFLLPPVLQYLDEHEKWPSSIYVIHIIHVITNAVQPQYRYVPMQNMLERLQDETGRASPESQTSMVRSLTYLISAGGGNIGMTVLELIEVLISQLLLHATRSVNGNAEATLEQALVEAVGSLATQVQYPDQVNEILAFLINRLKLELPVSALFLPVAAATASSTPNSISNIPATPTVIGKPPSDIVDLKTLSARKILLRCLQMVMHVRLGQVQSVSIRGDGGDASSQWSMRRGLGIYGTNVVRNPVDYSLIRPLLILMTDVDDDIRIYASEFLCTLFAVEAVESSMGLPTDSSPKFLMELNRSLYEYSIAPHNSPVDYIAIGTLFCNSVRKWGADQVLRAAAVLYKVQSMSVKSAKPLTPSQQRALGNVFIDFLMSAAEALSNLELREYAVKLRHDRVEARQVEVGLDTSSFEMVSRLIKKSFKDIESGTSVAPLSILVSETELNSILTNDAHIKKLPNVPERLTVEYIPESEASDNPPDAEQLVVGKNGKNRASVLGVASRGAGSTATVVGARKSSLSMQGSSDDEAQYSPIRVDDLKEALGTSSTANYRPFDIPELDVGMVPAATDSAAESDVRQLLNSIQSAFHSNSSKRSRGPLSSVPETTDILNRDDSSRSESSLATLKHPASQTRYLRYQQSQTVVKNSVSASSVHLTKSTEGGSADDNLTTTSNSSPFVIKSQPRAPTSVPEMIETDKLGVPHVSKPTDFLGSGYVKNAASQNSLRLKEPSVGGFQVRAKLPDHWDDVDASCVGPRSEISQVVTSASIHEHKLSWIDPPRTCLIVKKPNDEKTDQAFYTVMQYLCTDFPHLNIVVEPGTAPLFQSPPFAMPPVYVAPPGSPHEEYSRVVDFAIALGGDGTMLHLTSLFPKAVPPIISFSLGSLGFLLPYHIHHCRVALKKVVEGDVTVLLRMRLACGVYGLDGERIQGFAHDIQAMNEVLLYRGRMTHLTSLQVIVNNEVLTHAVADGLIVATPTGSTAYSLSAGGPIVHPSVQSMIMTPICPRSLSFRPIILPHTSAIQIALTPESPRSNAELSIDGRPLHMLQKSESIHVKMSSYPIPCVNRLYMDNELGNGLATSSKVSSGSRDWVRDINVMLRFNQSFRTTSDLRHFDYEDDVDDGEPLDGDGSNGKGEEDDPKIVP
ncbi:NAD+ kinase [Synchytrium endobioticum]|uniref:NAD+ kinase n=1 Tax=Synchytrium endobioticum TaxID=286115 RepID=A0A507CX78_9FUNG|nr:NAD+ kinase [Synchytrium endobioticum]